MENEENKYEEIEISEELKSYLDELKKIYGYEDYNEVINFLIEQAGKSNNETRT